MVRDARCQGLPCGVLERLPMQCNDSCIIAQLVARVNQISQARRAPSKRLGARGGLRAISDCLPPHNARDLAISSERFQFCHDFDGTLGTNG